MKKYFAPNFAYRAEFLKKINSQYPDVQTGVVGKSILGRDIDYYRIGSGGRNILVVGAHHAMEYITSSVLYDFIDFILEKNARGDTYSGINIPFLLQKFTFWIIPCLNPDGVEMQLCGAENNLLYQRQLRMNEQSTDFSHWQANARGVDLNHNYDAGFFEYKRLESECGICAGRSRYSGEFPESEPESCALAGFLRALAPSLVVTLHTQGEEIYAKPDTAPVRRVALRAAHAVGYRFSVATGLSAYGGFADYSGGVLGIPSFTVELGRGENPLPSSSLPSLADRARKLLVLLPTYL